MKRVVLALSLLLCCCVCSAQSVLVGKRLISKGDNIARVRDIAGVPTKIDKIPADGTSPAMEIWTYQHKDTVIVFWVVNEKVVQAQEEQPVPPTSSIAETASSSTTRTR